MRNPADIPDARKPFAEVQFPSITVHGPSGTNMGADTNIHAGINTNNDANTDNDTNNDNEPATDTNANAGADCEPALHGACVKVQALL